MAHLTSKNMVAKIDNASGTLTDISGDVNQMSLAAAITILDDSGLGDSQHTTLPGLAAAQVITLNGWLNSTVDAILGVLMGGTSITKTVVFGETSARAYRGEMWVQDITYSGTVDDLQTWSATFVAEAGLTRTSVLT